MTWTIIILLILIGLVFLVLEILVIPGATVVGILGFALVLLGVIQSYLVYGSIAGHITLGVTIILTFITIYFTLKSKTWNKAMLKDEITGKVNELDPRIQVGDTGKTISRLAPAGKALIKGILLEVQSMEGFVDHEKEVVISKIEDNKVFVNLIK
jgi:membrane-bound ClpP family serine protease